MWIRKSQWEDLQKRVEGLERKAACGLPDEMQVRWPDIGYRPVKISRVVDAIAKHIGIDLIYESATPAGVKIEERKKR